MWLEIGDKLKADFVKISATTALNTQEVTINLFQMYLFQMLFQMFQYLDAFSKLINKLRHFPVNNLL